MSDRPKGDCLFIDKAGGRDFRLYVTQDDSCFWWEFIDDQPHQIWSLATGQGMRMGKRIRELEAQSNDYDRPYLTLCKEYQEITYDLEKAVGREEGMGLPIDLKAAVDAALTRLSELEACLRIAYEEAIDECWDEHNRDHMERFRIALNP